MDKKLFNQIDNIKVHEKTKAELFEKIEQQKREKAQAHNQEQNTKQPKEPKTKNWLSGSKWLITGVVIGAVCMMLAIPFINGSVDYQQYVSSASEKVTKPYEQLVKEKKELRQKLDKGEITLDEFLEQYDKLQARAAEIAAQKDALNKEYGIDESDLDNSIKKASNEEKKSINSYMSEIERLEAEDDRLDQLEDQLERDYRNGKISRSEFVKQMRVLEQKEDELDRQEDKYEDEDDEDEGDDEEEDDDDTEDDDDEDDD